MFSLENRTSCTPFSKTDTYVIIIISAFLVKNLYVNNVKEYAKSNSRNFFHIQPEYYLSDIS